MRDTFEKKVSFDGILQDTSLDDVPFPIGIALCYIAFFLSATGALGVMALQEYLREQSPTTEK